jgi:hypothetical protein
MRMPTGLLSEQCSVAADCVPRLRVILHCHQWLMVPIPRISLTSAAFLAHSENTVVTQYLKIGPNRLSISLSNVPSYIWSYVDWLKSKHYEYQKKGLINRN